MRAREQLPGPHCVWCLDQASLKTGAGLFLTGAWAHAWDSLLACSRLICGTSLIPHTGPRLQQATFATILFSHE